MASAKGGGTSGARIPASNGGNRKDPPAKWHGDGIPSNYTQAYGGNTGTNAGGGKVPASNGGNRKDPAKSWLGDSIPPGYDSFNPPSK